MPVGTGLPAAKARRRVVARARHGGALGDPRKSQRRLRAPGTKPGTREAAPAAGGSSLFASLTEFDQRYRDMGYEVLCGSDEAGRGPLAGPVFAAAVILPAGLVIRGLNDSKRLSGKSREALYDVITAEADAFAVAMATEREIEEYNILGASLLAMKRAVEGLGAAPHCLLVDGAVCPPVTCHAEAVVGGDGKSAAIAAASVLAKVERDRYMRLLDREYPMYHFTRHKGYPTRLHYRMLDAYGPCPAHRESFLRKWRQAGIPMKYRDQ